jgi:V8-like Glu-specific endopeptidase
MKQGSTLLLLLFALLSSCAEEKVQEPTFKQEDISLAEINFIMNNQSVSCASIRGGGCPSGIARLFIVDRYNSEKSKLCSGFMVSESVLVTNHHCVNSAKACDDTYIAVYNGYSYRRTKCESILKSYEDIQDVTNPDRSQDFTVLKVSSPIFSMPFLLAKNKVRNNEKVTAWVVDQIDAYDSQITELRCRKSKEEKHKSMTLSGCPVISGNSGSPALNSKREVVGVIWGASNDGSIDEKTILSKRRGRDDAFAFVTELAYFVDYL